MFFSFLLSLFLQLRIDHASRTGVQFCFTVALPSQTSPIFFVHSALSSKPPSLSLSIHLSTHLCYAACVNTPAAFIMMKNTENHYPLCATYTLAVSGSPTVFLVFTPFSFLSSEERVQNPERERERG